MNLTLKKDDVNINRLVLEKKELFFIHNDIIVPDSKPDILNTINSTGNVCIYKKECLENKLKIDGCVNTNIIYLPDSKNENLRSLNCTIDFSEIFKIHEIKSNMTAILKSQIKDIECKVLNGRKVSVKIGIEFIIKVYSNENINVIKNIEDRTDIQTLNQDIFINSIIGSGKTNIYAKDTLNIDKNDEIAEILKLDYRLEKENIKISYNKVLSKTEIYVNVMYLTEDNRIEKVTARLPAVGFIDIANITEKSVCDVNYETKNLIVKPNSNEEHSIYIEFELEVTLIAYEKKKIELIQDLYSTIEHLSYNQKKVITVCDMNTIEKTFSINNEIKLPEIEKDKLIDVDIKNFLNNIKISCEKISFFGELIINFIFESSNVINSKSINIPFEQSIENEFKSEQIFLDVDIRNEKNDFIFTKEGVINCKIDLSAILKLRKNIEINLIDDIKCDEEKNLKLKNEGNLILYIVREGDTLWKIAKKYCSTIDEIINLNKFENKEKLNIGQKIFIPKCFIKRH